MVTREQLREVNELLRQLEQSAELCESVAHALIATDALLDHGGSIMALFAPTDYERARAEVMSQCTKGLSLVRKLRSQAISPHLIHAQHDLREMNKRCEKCPRVNARRHQNGRKFACSLKQETGTTRCRFRLNEKGEIIASE